jgi:hypothetical protein
MKVAHEGFAAKKRDAGAESKASSSASSMKRSRFRSIDRRSYASKPMGSTRKCTAWGNCQG